MRQNDRKYHSYHKYNTIKDPGEQTFVTIGADRFARGYSLQNSQKHRNNKSAKPRPKPLQIENEPYYNHIFPAAQDNRRSNRRSAGDIYFQPNSLDRAEL